MGEARAHCRGVRRAFTDVDDYYWQPLTWLSHMIDCQLFGVRPGWHHLTSLLLHIANVLLLFAILLRLTAAFWRSALVAAIFALHPTRIESVVWIAERKDLLSGFFFLAAIWCYLRYTERPSRGRYYTVLAVFVLGLMSKPMVMTLPVILLLLDWWPLGRRAFAEKLPMFMLAGISSFVTSIGTVRLGSINWGNSFSLGQRIANALISYVRYLELSFWPHDLAILYPFRTAVPAWQAALAALLLAGHHRAGALAGAPPALSDCGMAMVHPGTVSGQRRGDPGRVARHGGSLHLPAADRARDRGDLGRRRPAGHITGAPRRRCPERSWPCSRSRQCARSPCGGIA